MTIRLITAAQLDRAAWAVCPLLEWTPEPCLHCPAVEPPEMVDGDETWVRGCRAAAEEAVRTVLNNVRELTP